MLTDHGDVSADRRERRSCLRYSANSGTLERNISPTEAAFDAFDPRRL